MWIQSNVIVCPYNLAAYVRTPRTPEGYVIKILNNADTIIQLNWKSSVEYRRASRNDRKSLNMAIGQSNTQKASPIFAVVAPFS